MPADADWALQGPWLDKSLIRNAFSYDLARAMGAAGLRTRVCEVFLSLSGQPLRDADFGEYNSTMSREHLIRFATRDWATVARAKEQHWLREKRAAAGSDLCRRSDDLLRHARATAQVRLSAPADRSADWDVHHRVGQALRAVTRTTR
jgi:hypothetical protein